MNKTKQAILDAITDASHLGIRLPELHTRVNPSGPDTRIKTATLVSDILYLINGGYVKVAGGHIYATEYTELIRDNDGSIPMLTKHKASLAEEMEHLGTLTHRDSKMHGTDQIIKTLMEVGNVDPSDILRSVARVLTRKAMRMMRDDGLGMAETDSPGFAGCLLRDAGQIMNAISYMEG